jgi:hypothetical protein
MRCLPAYFDKKKIKIGIPVTFVRHLAASKNEMPVFYLRTLNMTNFIKFQRSLGWKLLIHFKWNTSYKSRKEPNFMDNLIKLEKNTLISVVSRIIFV